MRTIRSTGLKILFIASIVALPPAVAPSMAQTAPTRIEVPNPTPVLDLVYANHILYDQGVLDGFGHVSVRDDKNPGHFLMSRSMAPAPVKSKDILEFNLDGSPVDVSRSDIFVERFIHAAIYRARPDVKAIVHSHSLSVIPFSVTATSLRPIIAVSAFLGTGTPIFEIRDAAGGSTDMLIRDNKLGDALARSLGDHVVALLRGHGSVTVGNSIQQVVFRAFYTDVNAKLQLQAMALGKVNFLTPEEAQKAAVASDAQVGRPWELWKTLVGKIE